MITHKSKLLILVAFLLITFQINAQKKSTKKSNSSTEASTPKTDSLYNSGTFSALKFRGIGPAVTSGRVSDFAVNPDNHSEYYVATSAGGVWKTTNKGTTYVPIFDGEGSYSIGCVTIDPSNSNTIWVGSGENNNQRSVSYGDGVYKSTNGGAS
jgi:hypothetical protein